MSSFTLPLNMKDIKENHSEITFLKSGEWNTSLLLQRHDDCSKPNCSSDTIGIDVHCEVSKYTNI